MRLLVVRVRGQVSDATVLALLFVSFLIVAIDGQALSPLFPLLSRQFGVDPGQAVLVTGAFQVALLLSPFLARGSPGRGKLGLVAGLAVFVAGCRLSAMAPTFLPFLGARFVTGLASALLVPALGAYVGDRFPYGRRGRVMALVRSAWSLAGVAGIPLAAWVAEEAGTAALFGGLALAGTANAALLALLLPPAPGAPAAAAGRSPTPVHLLVLAISCLWIIGPCSVFFFLAAHLEGRFGLPTPVIGLVFSVCAVAGLGGNLLSGWAADRWGKRAVTLLGLTVMAASLASLPRAATTELTVLLAAAMTLGLETGWAAFQTLASELDPPARRAILAASNLGYGLGSILTAFLAPWLGRAGGFGGAVCLGLAATLGALGLSAGRLPQVPGDAGAS